MLPRRNLVAHLTSLSPSLSSSSDDIAYRHNPYTHCPTNVGKYHDNGKCNCDPKDCMSILKALRNVHKLLITAVLFVAAFDLDGYSCMRHAWRVVPSEPPFMSL